LTCSFFSDWGPKIDVVGFCFLDLASNYEPPEPLLRWLGSGEKPIYIGFGSLVSFYLVLKINVFYCFQFFYYLLQVTIVLKLFMFLFG